MGVVVILYEALIFKKIMLFDDRIEVHFVNKVIVRTYSQIKSCYIYKGGYVWSITKQLFLKCEPKFRHAYLNNTLLDENELYKIKEILIKKGVKDDDWI
ncbi:hypothetical protein [Campylobacter sp.]|nr:hypothetical protein [Campylobacter sp.]